MNRIWKLTLALSLLVWRAVADTPPGPERLPDSFHHALLDILGPGPAFSGRIRITFTNAEATTGAWLAFANGRTRLELDPPATGPNVSPVQAAKLSLMRSTVITRPEINRLFLVFPNMKSYVASGYSQRTGSDPAPPADIVRTKMGTENLNGLACTKTAWTITETGSGQFTATVWAATNAPTVPVRIQFDNPAATVDFLGSDPGVPGDDLFQPPAGYVKYSGMRDLPGKTNAAEGSGN